MVEQIPNIADLSAGQATERLATLTGNAEWAQKFLDGNVDARRDFSQLSARVASGDRIADAVAGTATPSMMETTVGGELSVRNTLAAVDGLREIGIPDKAITEILKGTPFSPEDVATARRWKEDAMGNKEWTGRYLSGEPEARRQMTTANAILASGVKEAT